MSKQIVLLLLNFLQQLHILIFLVYLIIRAQHQLVTFRYQRIIIINVILSSCYFGIYFLVGNLVLVNWQAFISSIVMKLNFISQQSKMYGITADATGLLSTIFAFKLRIQMCIKNPRPHSHKSFALLLSGLLTKWFKLNRLTLSNFNTQRNTCFLIQ